VGLGAWGLGLGAWGLGLTWGLSLGSNRLLAVPTIRTKWTASCIIAVIWDADTGWIIRAAWLPSYHNVRAPFNEDSLDTLTMRRSIVW